MTPDKLQPYRVTHTGTATSRRAGTARSHPRPIVIIYLGVEIWGQYYFLIVAKYM